MPPRRGRGRRGAAEPEDRVDRIGRILEGLVQVVHDVHNNNNHDNAPQQPAMPMAGAGTMPRTTIKSRTDLVAIEEATGAIVQGNMIVVVYNAKFMELSRYAPHIVSTESRKARRFEAGLRWNIKNKVEILRLPTHQEKQIGGNVSRGQSSKRQSSGSSSGNSSAQQGNIVSQGSRHQIRDCPMRKRIQGAGTSASASVQQPPTERRNNQPRQGRAFALVPRNTPATTLVVLVPLEYELSVSLPSGDTMICDRIYSSCEIRVNNVPMYVDLIPLEMHGFDVILGMDWLSSYRALIDCELKRVVFHSFAHSGLIFEGVGVVPPPYLISSMKARRLIQKGSQAFLCSIVNTHVSPPTLEDIHVVREFPDVFPDELPERAEIEVVAPDTNTMLTTMIAQPTLMEIVKRRQPEDPYLWKVYEEMLVNPKPDFTLQDRALKFQGRLCVPNIPEVKRRVLEEAHNTKFAMHPGGTKIDFKRHGVAKRAMQMLGDEIWSLEKGTTCY
ncbi:hypothetical protein Acr_28g0004320 [Actinidia rufa]|uniref:Reverse transcriptase domain-containing protein n=1 Tax=Actinidia rufa TaxID=165716 RepID=A0A7J0H9E7_9ERIC|nr:hypothetical protein Acr_28g0004320 [Actinidia rufa]